MKINLHNLAASIRTLLGNVQTHLADNSKHITADERTSWNNKTNDSKIASSTELGHVKVGENLTIGTDGKLSAVTEHLATKEELENIALTPGPAGPQGEPGPQGSAADLTTTPYTGSLNNLLETGFYSCDSATVTDLPASAPAGRPWMVISSIDGTTGNGLQMASSTVNPFQMFSRRRTLTGSWGDWTLMIGEPTWIRATLSNGWENNSVMDTLKYFKDSLGFVHVRGIVYKDNPSTAAFTTFPTGYRPVSDMDYVVADFANAGRRVRVKNTGEISLGAAGSGLTAISVNISFPTN